MVSYIVSFDFEQRKVLQLTPLMVSDFLLMMLYIVNFVVAQRSLSVQSSSESINHFIIESQMLLHREKIFSTVHQWCQATI